MRIIEAEPQLVAELLEELEALDSRDRGAYKVYVGHHRMMGRVVVVIDKEGVGTIVELE
jgi:hypothetical protein